jgi:hypothetical protein
LVGATPSAAMPMTNLIGGAVLTRREEDAQSAG